MDNRGNDARRRGLIKISQFVLRPEAVGIRDTVENALVEGLLYSNEPKGMTLGELLEAASKEFSLTFTKGRMSQVVNRLIDSTSVRSDARYHLTAKAGARVREAVNLSEQKIDAMLTQVVGKVEKHGEPLDTESRESILDGFYYFVSTFLESRAEFVKSTFLGTAEYRNLDISKILQESCGYIRFPRLVNPFRLAIEEMFSLPSQATVEFFGISCQNLVAMRVMNIDPECQALQKDAFAKKTLLLDTNVVIAALCETSELHGIAIETLKVCNDLGVHLVVTARTMQEFMAVLERSNYLSDKLKMSARRLVDLGGDEFLSAFGAQKLADPSRTWEAYYMEMKRSQTRLAKEWKVVLHSYDHREIRTIEGYDTLTEVVSQCAKKERGGDKLMVVAEHDAYHMLLAKSLRNKETASIVGPSHWFLTFDRSLFCAEPKVSELYKSDLVPSSVECELWLELVAPLLPRQGESRTVTEVFQEILKSRFARLGPRLNLNDLLAIQGDWLRYDILTTNDIESILSEKFVKDYLKLVRDSSNTQALPDFKPEFEKQLSLKVDELVKKRLDSSSKEIEQLKIERNLQDQNLKSAIAAKDIEIAALKNKRNEEKFKLVWRSIAGILGLILLAVDIIRASTAPSSVTEVAFLSATLLFGVILLFIAIAYERVIVRIVAR